MALAQGLRQGGSIDEGGRQGIRLRRRHILMYRWLTALFTPVCQSDSRLLPLIRDRVVGPLAKLWPVTAIQAAMVSGLVGNPLLSLGLCDVLDAAVSVAGAP
ncbi:hypothetical protein GCM10009075_10830 [Sphingomonas trueperi]